MNVLITGGSRGIGRACVKAFARIGHNVYLNYNKNHEQAQKTAHEFGANLCRADITDQNAVRAMIDSIGKIDILINNAGIAQQKIFQDITYEEWHTMFDVNIHGMFYTTQAVIPDMIRRKRGCIVNISSIWGQSGASCEVHYSAAKSAVIGFTKALAKEVAPSGVRVNAVAPGVIDTDMNAHITKEEILALADETPIGRIGTPDDVANAVLFLTQPESSFITGQVIGVDGGFLV